MTQQRIYDFGAILTQGRAKKVSAALLAPGIYSGMEPTLLSNPLIKLSAGEFLLPNGVLVIEDAEVEITPPTVTSAADYTLVATHEDIQAVGGSPIIYTWEEGILPRSGSPTSNALAILWLRHPGSMTINSSMVSLPLKVKNAAGIGSFEASQAWLQAPFPQATDVFTGPNVTATPASTATSAKDVGLRITNTAAFGLQGYQFRLPLPLLPRVRKVEVYVQLPSLGTLELSAAPIGGNTVTTNNYNIVTTSGTVATVTPSQIAGPIADLSTPAATFVLGNTADAPVSMGVTIKVPPGGGQAFLKGFKLVGD
jgi:hypothetical protein